eukprot:scaffold15213_cov156-Skeletonema_menzelii.AAC.2
MTSAANKAAKTLKGSRRNRPSLSMSQVSTSVGESSGENLGGSFTAGSTGGGGGPLFMDDLQSQYESLSDKLTRENTTTAAASSQHSDPKSGMTSAGSKSSRKVRWAETAAVASTMDAENAAAANEDDPDRYERSPMEIISDLFQRKYTLPIFLMSTLAIFLMVHLAGGGDEKYKRYDASSKTVGLSSGTRFNRYKNLEGGEGFGEATFSLSPTSVNMLQTSIGPTSEAIGHSTPKIPGSSPTGVTADDGNAADWIIVPTQSGVFGTATGPNDGSPTTLKWNFAEGQPTPDPIHLKDFAKLDDAGSPTTITWNYPPGVPTPDPALLIEVAPDRGTPTTLKWNLGLGVPTPDPILHPDHGTPTTLKWSIANQEPYPAEATWDYPPGVPTPDPALLTYGGGETLVWGYPPGEPTPDPIHLVHVPDDATLVWGYPPGYPTPDPVFLVDGGATEVLKWNYPDGEPTPDPAQLSQLLSGSSDPPTIRNVEVGIAMAPPPTRRPTPKPTEKPVPQIDEGLLLKMDNIEASAPASTIAPKEEPALIPPEPTSKPSKKPSQPPTPEPTQSSNTELDVFPIQDGEDPQEGEGDRQTRPPQAPQVIYDAFGNVVEAAPPPRPPPRPQRPGRPERPPRPAVNVNEVDSWTYFDGPNGITLPGQPGYIPGQPGQPGQVPLVGGVVNTQCGGCCGCCNGCGGSGVSGGTTVNLVLPGGDHLANLIALLAGDTKAIATSDAQPGFTMAPSLMKQPECPWSCVIDENVPTHGQSNQDDAIYEIFYSNPLNCCGTIVEIGAGNGIEGSSSYFFEYGMNWTSILTEANPKKYSKLVQNRNGKKARTLNGAYCKDGPYALYDDTSGLFKSVGNDIISEEVSMDVPDTAQNVPCIRLDRDVLAGVNHVNVMMVHVTGDPWPVLSTMDWNVSVDVWVLELDETGGMSHETLRAALKLHGYVHAKWDIKLWCDAPKCMQNEVWLREGFNPISKQILQAGLRGSSSTS